MRLVWMPSPLVWAMRLCVSRPSCSSQAESALHSADCPPHAGSSLHNASNFSQGHPSDFTLDWCCRVTAIRISPLLNAQAALFSPAAPSSLLLQGSLPGDASQLSALQVMEIAGQR